MNKIIIIAMVVIFSMGCTTTKYIVNPEDENETIYGFVIDKEKSQKNVSFLIGVGITFIGWYAYYSLNEYANCN